jgi:hypothetical protein
MASSAEHQTPIVAATEKSIKAANLADIDAGAVAVLRKLAEAADAIDENGLNPAGKLDNVTIPTYRAYAESLGLTPAGRVKLAEGKKPEAKTGGNLASVSNIPRPA